MSIQVLVTATSVIENIRVLLATWSSPKVVILSGTQCAYIKTPVLLNLFQCGSICWSFQLLERVSRASAVLRGVVGAGILTVCFNVFDDSFFLIK